jgi:3-oxoacyl-[acyl-carrier-protein] synthase II
VTAAHAAGAAAACVADDLLRGGRADALLCVGVEALSPLALQVYAALPALRPRAGRGYLLAEGGVALVLECRRAARARGARILGVLTGHGIACDAAGIGRWDPGGAGIERAMRIALAAARLDPADLAAIWATTTGLPAVDRPEHDAIARLPGTADVPIRQPKLTLGDPVGAGALVSAALALHQWDTGSPAGPVLVNSSSLGGTHISLILSPDP